MEKFREQLLKILELCNDELMKRKKGILGESTQEQLETVILPELEQLLKIVDGNTLPQKDQRYLISFASAFTIWGWDMQNPTDIFLLITKLNNDYKHL